ncbi:signal peptidase I [Paenibacillus glycanilyticus]|uniref:signal peptidase I n=1 Tax=Paenibacillus glycanilyticus TaxID=126569 RepID=UPI00203FEB05|nr:signal peptidase I [Paenibacillus glycanilyticus]MCM3629034.1 signal peptidase I [Paenibacillus glycanilyticus]
MRIAVYLFLIIGIIPLLAGCANTLNDPVTEKRIKEMQTPDPSLTKVKVETDGMLSDVYVNERHPFGLHEYVWADMEYYKNHDVTRGDIVVFRTKNNPEQRTDIARVVGLPGESVRIKKGQVYINDKKLVAFYGNDPTSDDINDSWEKLTLKSDEYYILADVRWRGLNDSQTKGPFHKEDLLGKVTGYLKK